MAQFEKGKLISLTRTERDDLWDLIYNVRSATVGSWPAGLDIPANPTRLAYSLECIQRKLEEWPSNE